MARFTIATWNVNSLKVRLPQVLDYLEANPVDALCLQELKMQDADIPKEAFEEKGFDIFFNGQKTYNGVATVLRRGAYDAFEEVVLNNPLFEDPQKRLIAGTVKVAGTSIRLVNGYFPNGESLESDKFPYKLAWLEALRNFIEGELKAHENLVLVGDFNIAPEDRDVYDPEGWKDSVLCTEASRSAFTKLLDLGLSDAFRAFEQPEKSYTWWDYRMMAFRRNRGLRIDHILISEALKSRNIAVTVDKAVRKNERPSDHAPVRIELDL